LEELKPFMTAQNIPNEEDRSSLWTYLIEEEYRKGRTLNELQPFIIAQNIPYEVKRSVLWSSLSRKNMEK
jgi:hypothetical protein